METLAYIHLAIAYEESTNIEPRAVFAGAKAQAVNWKKLARRASVPVLSLAISLLGLSHNQAEAALQRGDDGPEVSDLQNQLLNAGYYDGPVTGYFGDLTEEAVKRLQQAKGQAVTGVVDDKTYSSLQPALSDSTDGSRLALGDRGQYVTDLQNNLKAAGYYNGPISGYFGLQTEDAVMEFQKVQGLEVDGIAGQATLNSLQQVAMATSADAGQPPEKLDERIEEASANLTKGANGPEVADLQTRLQAAGCYNGPISATYDDSTEAAVRRCQSVTESADASSTTPPATEPAQKAESVPAEMATPQEGEPAQKAESVPTEMAIAQNLALGATGPAVTELQNRLKAAGYYEGLISGEFDVSTEASVLRFQRDQGIAVDGIVGPTTFGLLATR